LRNVVVACVERPADGARRVGDIISRVSWTLDRVQQAIDEFILNRSTLQASDFSESLASLDPVSMVLQADFRITSEVFRVYTLVGPAAPSVPGGDRA
jgi:hypothetical protein